MWRVTCDVWRVTCDVWCVERLTQLELEPSVQVQPCQYLLEILDNYGAKHDGSLLQGFIYWTLYLVELARLGQRQFSSSYNIHLTCLVAINFVVWSDSCWILIERNGSLREKELKFIITIATYVIISTAHPFQCLTTFIRILKMVCKKL